MRYLLYIIRKTSITSWAIPLTLTVRSLPGWGGSGDTSIDWIRTASVGRPKYPVSDKGHCTGVNRIRTTVRPFPASCDVDRSRQDLLFGHECSTGYRNKADNGNEQGERAHLRGEGGGIGERLLDSRSSCWSTLVTPHTINSSPIRRVTVRQASYVSNTALTTSQTHSAQTRATTAATASSLHLLP